ncbi:MAG: hypothetical protein AAF585_15905, partial [Verrucomicrobiota bacterium]
GLTPEKEWKQQLQKVEEEQKLIRQGFWRKALAPSDPNPEPFAEFERSYLARQIVSDHGVSNLNPNILKEALTGTDAEITVETKDGPSTIKISPASMIRIGKDGLLFEEAPGIPFSIGEIQKIGFPKVEVIPAMRTVPGNLEGQPTPN